MRQVAEVATHLTKASLAAAHHPSVWFWRDPLFVSSILRPEMVFLMPLLWSNIYYCLVGAHNDCPRGDP